ncbi:hypothetical protein BCAH820_A0002 (plasmid) [Bacillus cereus AH820]|uniref:Uncharacterized protein n=2 Tax=Bacillus cereus TaxID=1396 RepID=B7I1N8_BACC7|nr:hypothetical protein BCAH187_B0002 [Bacillus cereus AH187]ACK92630.1 hypothetical protein BCAH820_A0002 [Bacillus cereus AH820]
MSITVCLDTLLFSVNSLVVIINVFVDLSMFSNMYFTTCIFLLPKLSIN